MRGEGGQEKGEGVEKRRGVSKREEWARKGVIRKGREVERLEGSKVQVQGTRRQVGAPSKFWGVALKGVNEPFCM